MYVNQLNTAAPKVVSKGCLSLVAPRYSTMAQCYASTQSPPQVFAVVRSSIVVHEYVNNGSDIYRESFRIIRSEANLDRFPTDVEGLSSA